MRYTSYDIGIPDMEVDWILEVKRTIHENLTSGLLMLIYSKDG